MGIIFTGIVRVGVGSLFLVSGASKVLRAKSVKRMITNYRLVPRWLLPIVAKMMAPIEVATGMLLMASLWMPVYGLAWVLSIGLLSAFSFAVATALARGLEIPCGCGLLLNGHIITRAALVRNLTLLALLTLDRLTPGSLRP